MTSPLLLTLIVLATIVGRSAEPLRTTTSEGAPALPEARQPVRVFLPADDNLQWLNFWVALGAGYFADEGLEVETLAGIGGDALERGAADVAVLPRPAFLTQVGRGRALVAFANLLANDPISLVVPRSLAEARGMSAAVPLATRLRAMEGLRVGVAPGPPSRLRFLFESVGLNADEHVEIVIVPGPEQNRALETGAVDALYAHTPYLERALVDQGAVIVADQQGGEVAGLADRQIHMLATTRTYADAHPDVLVAMARAVHRAQRLIHSDRDRTLAAIRASGVRIQAPHALETTLSLYEPAVPRSPEVSVEKLIRELDLFPDRRPLPDLSGIDLSEHVDNRYAREAVAGIP